MLVFKGLGDPFTAWCEQSACIPSVQHPNIHLLLRSIPPGAHRQQRFPAASLLLCSAHSLALPKTPPNTSLTSPVPFSLSLQINQGTVVAVGPGRRTSTGELVPVSVKEGDKVLLPEYGGTQVKLQEKE